LRRIIPSLLLVAAVAAAVAGSYVTLYPTGGGAPYAGFDTSWYIWRAKATAEYGIRILPELSGSLFQAHPARVGHPLFAGFVASATGIDPLRLAYALPSVMGTTVGVAAGAFAVAVLREPRWAFLVYAVGVGASVNVVLTSVGHADTLLSLALAMAAATAAVSATERGRGLAAGIILLTAAAVLHLFFAMLYASLLLVLAVAVVPRSLRARREGLPWHATPFARLTLLVGGAVVGAMAAMLLAPGAPVRPVLLHAGFLDRIARDVAVYRFPLLGPLAVGGIAALLFPPHPSRRRGLLFVLIWAAAAGVAALASLLLPVPAHRMVAFSLGIPILAAAAVAGGARMLLRRLPWVAGGIIVAALTTSVLAGSVWLARDGWRSAPQDRLEALSEAAAAGRYLDVLGGDRPVVFVVAPRGPRPQVRASLQFDVIRVGLPPEQILRSHLYVGRPDRLLEGDPTVYEGRPDFTAVSRATWRDVRPILDRDPIILATAAFNPDAVTAAPGGTSLPGGLTVFRAPATDVPAGPALSGSPPMPALVGSVAAILALLLVAGAGWSAGLAPGGPLARMCLAPALGLATLIIGGLVAGSVGLDTPGPRRWVLVGVIALGWIPGGVRLLRNRRREPGDPDEVGPPSAATAMC
jgi:hypothetical protein